ncbi:SGNH/GDSL hydrolase family protein [Pseudomonas kurunegalensis]|uniref:SGNH/GDSL hydrolase family protein n=1 Tax=Pseudomonas kurunegalensis TaxID=485880 RepID=UPI00236466E0|nr:SGNH/GDSL hydrolase family protein [Pseudomonas kurunegalensis]MDD2134586.1 SGNH/GDSL hydrolase family protein [Pseudomonas kurunegalensis]
MKTISLIALVGSLALCFNVGAAKSESHPPIKKVVSFGDSLTDAGTFWFRFTTNPGYTWAQHLALHYGQEPLPNQHVISYDQVYKGIPGMDGPGGLNYAQGGARANHPYSRVSQNPEGTPISAKVQVEHFLKQHQRFKGDELVTLYIGTNDVAYNYDLANDPQLAKQLRDDIKPGEARMNEERTRITVAADDTAQVAKSILDHGAKRLVVLKLVDMGGMPWFRTDASRAFASELSLLFNRELSQRLPVDSRLLVVDTPAFIEGLVSNGKAVGIKYGLNEDACKAVDQDFCYPNGLKSSDADQTYIYAASEHMTSKANALLAEYVIKRIEESSIK